MLVLLTAAGSMAAVVVAIQTVQEYSARIFRVLKPRGKTEQRQQPEVIPCPKPKSCSTT
jgi:hypothetical protein